MNIAADCVCKSGVPKASVADDKEHVPLIRKKHLSNIMEALLRGQYANVNASKIEIILPWNFRNSH